MKQDTRPSFYFSSIVGHQVVDADGEELSEVADVVVHWQRETPQITGLKCDDGRLIPVTAIAHWEVGQIRLKAHYVQPTISYLAMEEFFLKRQVLDRNIVDLLHGKVVRATDAKLVWTDEGSLLLHGIDVGFRGIMRRIGIGFAQGSLEKTLVQWEHILLLDIQPVMVKQVAQGKVGGIHPADLAEILNGLERRQRLSLFRLLDAPLAADVLIEMENSAVIDILETIEYTRSCEIVKYMARDDVSDILACLPEWLRNRIQSGMEEADVQATERLMAYHPNTAGSIMTDNFISLAADLSAKAALLRVQEQARAAETIYYLYCLDSVGRLQGVISLRELILASPDQPVSELMKAKVIKIGPQDDCRKAADLIRKYNLIALPVVDEAEKIIGIITVDDVLDVLLTADNTSEAGLLYRYWKLKEPW